LCKRACIFCGGKKVTQEHYLGKAFIRRIFADGRRARYDFYRTNYIADTFTTERTPYVATAPDVTASCACETCNSGWMDRARLRIEPLIEPMIRGQTTRVTKLVDVIALASWGTQVGLCAAHGVVNIVKTMGPAFYESRMPFPGHRIRLAQAVTPESTLQVTVNVTQLHSAPRYVRSRLEGYTVTIRIDHLILQVFCPPAGYEAEVASKPQWDELTIPVWPLTFESIDWPWPPRRPLDSIDFHHLTQAYFEPPPKRPVAPHLSLPPARG
jgi:hypothetical protein